MTPNTQCVPSVDRCLAFLWPTTGRHLGRVPVLLVEDESPKPFLSKSRSRCVAVVKVKPSVTVRVR
jgi:hypothetical protein